MHKMMNLLGMLHIMKLLQPNASRWFRYLSRIVLSVLLNLGQALSIFIALDSLVADIDEDEERWTHE